MLIKNKNITSCQLLLTKQDRGLLKLIKILACLTSESGIFFFIFRMAKWVLNKNVYKTISLRIHWCMLINNINSK